jgi:uncharacterized BrkB/YihY/UPF0761 family membrane protein
VRFRRPQQILANTKTPSGNNSEEIHRIVKTMKFVRYAIIILYLLMLFWILHFLLNSHDKLKHHASRYDIQERYLEQNLN